MNDLSWGTLGPESNETHRRIRPLGLGAAVRAFNEAAVPGVGVLWYAKQLMLAALGVQIAAHTDHSNIVVANAIEALACLLAFNSKAGAGPVRDACLRGRRKLAGRSADISFKTVSKHGFYVTQPMRMGMTQPLMDLGFAEGEGGSSRFNALSLTAKGTEFVEEALKGYRPYNRSVEAHLSLWIRGDTDRNGVETLSNALSPLVTMPGSATDILTEQLYAGVGGDRRKKALSWVRAVTDDSQPGKGWECRPDQIDPDHWRDLEAGARFFELRDEALACLDVVETRMARQDLSRLSFTDAVEDENIKSAINDVTKQAVHFLALQNIPNDAMDAIPFAEVLATSAQLPILQYLVQCDDRVLVERSDDIGRGPAFDDTPRSGAALPDEENDDPELIVKSRIPLPKGISLRMGSLTLLALDLDGKLGGWLNERQTSLVGEFL
jgi:hypothetical protein